jgi:hypothetical protein
MPYELELPQSLSQRKVKIFDKELLIEEPHLTIIFKQRRWRFGLRTRAFLDEDPSPNDVPKKLLELINAGFERLCNEWDARFPTNPVSPAEEEEE